MYKRQGEVTAESGEAIRKARRAYDLLSEDQKALVNNYDVLLAAEEQFALLSGDGSGSQNGGTSAAVSYTHLDVYKRQGYSLKAR